MYIARQEHISSLLLVRLCSGEEDFCIRDHSVLSWKLLVAGPGVEEVTGGKGDLSSRKTMRRYVVHEDYTAEESSFIKRKLGI